MNVESGPVNGLVIAAPSSGSGKTVLTLGLLRHLARSGQPVRSAKAGPDYIDPAFHAAATGSPCYNLDLWSMRPSVLEHAASLGAKNGTVICEGVMGLFDGTVMEAGSTADLAEQIGWPVVLIIDAAAQGASAGAVLRGFASHRPGFALAGVVFNRVGGERHRDVLREAAALAAPDVKILGFVPRAADLSLPDRHLGLVQAIEHNNLTRFLDAAADLVSANIDIEGLLDLAKPMRQRGDKTNLPIPPLGQRIAIAEDEAFTFRYPLTLEGWKAQGAELSFFSPLNDEAPAPEADAVYLPGGYPELHGYRLGSATRFMDGVKKAAGKGVTVFGECGGYMVLGKGLTDKDGARHVMAGLLPLETSFAKRRLHLGYREVELDAGAALGSGKVLGNPGQRYRGHEFHYATVTNESPGAPLFKASNAAGDDLGLVGLADGRVMGSFIHMIDRMEYDD
ncbi:MAG TPA: cobyrinate a,c-diamide synthase [Rhodospirillales bacterium]|nr:cobyrinate a,c-diamide synthase [Rhodospirillales bacterium]